MKLASLPIALVTCLLALPGQANAEYVRFRYIPVDACGNMSQVPAGPGSAWANSLTASAKGRSPIRG